MIVHKCDRCGRELAVWMTVKVYPGAMNRPTTWAISYTKAASLSSARSASMRSSEERAKPRKENKHAGGTHWHQQGETVVRPGGR